MIKTNKNCWPCISFNSDNTAVVVVDMQNDFCHEKGRLAAQGGNISLTRKLVPAIHAFIQALRGKGVQVVWVRHINSDETMSDVWLQKRSELGRSKYTVCEKGTWGAELAEPLEIMPGDKEIIKHRHGAFFKTGMDEYLRGKGIKNVIIVGASTNACVDTTIREAYSRDYFVFVPDNLVGTTRPELQEPFIDNIGYYFATVTDDEEILARL